MERGIHADFRYVPLLIGSLYGGTPVAVFFGLVLGVYSFLQIKSQWEYLYLAAFLVLFLLPLIRFSCAFRLGMRPKRLKTILLFCIGLMLFFCATLPVRYQGEQISTFLGDLSALLINWAVFFLTVISSVKFIELGFERVNLQNELQDMSRKYRGEMRRLQQFIDQAPLSVIFLNSSGIVSHINDFALRFIQPISRKDILNRHYHAFTLLMNFDSPSPIERVMKGEERVVEMLSFRGRTVYTVTCAIKGMQSQSSDGILFIGHDVTELQQLKDEVGRMERLSLVGQMAASISHEIRNPMAVIRGFVQLLNERSSAEQQSYFRIVMEELDRANGIINDFLSLAQNRIVEKESGSLHEVLNEIMPLIGADANMRGQMVDLRLCETIGPLEINSKEIKQLVLNLARNGMEAMSDNGILRIETVDQADTIQLRVTDHGVGIPREKLERLFEPFYTTKANGTGLGLALCLSIVERHNGKIQVESTVGEGTTFIVTFFKPGRRYMLAK
jgi:signal transduction histidine kinase